jgi:diguanylate cyclase (GGDEF)-like protein
VGRLLPLIAGVSPARARAARVAAVLMAVATVANLAVNALCDATGSLDAVTNRWGQNVALAAAVALAWLAADRERRGSRALAAALTVWTAGNLVWCGFFYADAAPPYPSAADLLWIAFYPLAYLCVGLRIRAAVASVPASLWLDGLVGALTVAAAGSSFVVLPILGQAAGSPAAVLTNSANAMGDLLLVSLLAGVVALHAWRPGRGWWLLGLGFGIFAGADSYYLYRLAMGTYAPGSWLDSMWVVGIAVMALAAWQPAPAPGSADLTGHRLLVLPLMFGAPSLAVLVAAGLGDLPPAGVLLAAAALAVSMLRAALTLGEVRALSASRVLAHTDELTGLPNRRAFDRALHDRLAAAGRREAELAVLVIDLDHFKEVNDTLGHHAGDRVLTDVAARLRGAVRDHDVLGRLGGDEFAALMPGREAAAAAASRIAAALARPFSVDGIEVEMTASIGTAVFGEHGADATTLLRQADVAMYQAKSGRSGHEFYASERDGHTRDRLKMVGELRAAVHAGALALHVQPKVALPGGELIGVEALVRWPHPERGLVPPGEFVPIAERGGLMRPLTAWVLDEALRLRAGWAEGGLEVPVAVNVSASNLLEPDWVDEVAAALERHAVAPDALVLEITEDVLMADPERALEVVAALAATGVRLAVDDFGTGYSSLAYLKRLPLDELKIDRTFIADLVRDPADAAIVQATVHLGLRLGLDVVAEGVEDAETLARLAACGATAAQGFHVARPMPPEALPGWARARRARHGAGVGVA